MTDVHLLPSLDWEECTTFNTGCELPFHLSDTTLPEVQDMNYVLLNEMLQLEKNTPAATQVHSHHSEWLDADGERHRDYDLPAVIYSDGSKYWYRHGQIHREHDRPAIEYASGNLEWWQNDQMHRDADKPAYMYGGNWDWYKRGLNWREGDKPNQITEWGDQVWTNTAGYKDRSGGKPAVIHADGTQEYWSRGKMFKVVTPENEETLFMTKLNVVQGDIITYDADAIVNAANTSLLGGGGVDGAIHRAAGKELVAACRLLGGAKTGEAKITGAFNLRRAKYIIHTPGPVYKGLGAEKSAPLLADCYRNSLDLTQTKEDIHRIAFSAISTGIYGYPLKDATQVAVDTIRQWITDHPENNLEDITLIAFSDEDYKVMSEIVG